MLRILKNPWQLRRASPHPCPPAAPALSFVPLLSRYLLFTFVEGSWFPQLELKCSLRTLVPSHFLVLSAQPPLNTCLTTLIKSSYHWWTFQARPFLILSHGNLQQSSEVGTIGPI